MSFKLYRISQFYSTSGRGSGCIESGIFSDEFIKQAVDLLVEKIYQKYSGVRVAAEYSLQITKGESDNFITVYGKFCLGDGDYIDRCVRMPFPKIDWETGESGQQLTQKLRPIIDHLPQT